MIGDEIDDTKLTVKSTPWSEDQRSVMSDSTSVETGPNDNITG